MADHDGDTATHAGTEETKKRRGRRGAGTAPRAVPPPPAASGGEPGLMKTLWADIRGRRLPRQPTADELAWEAEDEAEELAARGGVTGLDQEHYDRLRQRSGPR